MFIKLTRWVWAVSLSLVVFVLGGGGAYWVRQQGLQTAQAEAVQLGQTVGTELYQVMKKGMSANDHAHVRQVVTEAVGPTIVQARIIGLEGKVYADSGRARQGQQIAKQNPGCIECHRVTPPNQVTLLNFLPDRVRVATPIANESTCASCHNTPNRSSLGMVLVDVSFADHQNVINAQTGVILGAGTLLAFLSGWALLGFPSLRGTWRWPALRGAWPSVRLMLMGGGVAISVGVVALSGGLAAAHLENDSAFCASCHTEPETTYYQRSLTTPTDLASAHAEEEVACVECHSGEGAIGRGETLALGAKNLVFFVTGQYQSPTQAATPITNDHCLKCHNGLVRALDQPTHFHYFTTQWANASACVACHPAHTLGDTVKTRYTTLDVVRPICTECHTAADD